VVTQVTGEAGFAADLTNVFNGADLKLLLATVLVVAFLLVLTYRSALLWLVPLIVIGFASQVAAAVAGKTLPHLGLTFDAATSGILSVLVFGAGTDYALLLVSRYRDELKRHESRFDAMREALAEAAPAILGSGLTVTLALVTLALAEIPRPVRSGWPAPSASSSLSWRRWPSCPRPSFSSVGGSSGRSSRATAPTLRQPPVTSPALGERVRHVPVMATILSLVVLAILATGTFSLTLGLSQTQSFRSTPESVLGQETLAKAFPAGATAPTIVMTTPEAAAQVASSGGRVPGVFSARAGEATSTLARVDVILKDAPDTTGSYQAIEALREALADVPSVEHHALVGGQVAEDYDLRQAWSHDRGLLIPLVALVIFIVLMVVLRSLLAPVLLMVTVIASYFGALGPASSSTTTSTAFPEWTWGCR
jgi:RND superfamily putative drug exporter